jgi:hypothetical protein
VLWSTLSCNSLKLFCDFFAFHRTFLLSLYLIIKDIRLIELSLNWSTDSAVLVEWLNVSYKEYSKYIKTEAQMISYS